MASAEISASITRDRLPARSPLTARLTYPQVLAIAQVFHGSTDGVATTAYLTASIMPELWCVSEDCPDLLQWIGDARKLIVRQDILDACRAEVPAWYHAIIINWAAKRDAEQNN